MVPIQCKRVIQYPITTVAEPTIQVGYNANFTCTYDTDYHTFVKVAFYYFSHVVNGVIPIFEKTSQYQLKYFKPYADETGGRVVYVNTGSIYRSIGMKITRADLKHDGRYFCWLFVKNAIGQSFWGRSVRLIVARKYKL